MHNFGKFFRPPGDGSGIDSDSRKSAVARLLTLKTRELIANYQKMQCQISTFSNFFSGKVGNISGLEKSTTPKKLEMIEKPENLKYLN